MYLVGLELGKNESRSVDDFGDSKVHPTLISVGLSFLPAHRGTVLSSVSVCVQSFDKFPFAPDYLPSVNGT